MLNRVKEYIAQEQLIKPGELLILAVSGGPDSMVLLHIMHELSRELDFKLAAAHLNHALRPEAGAEEAMVYRHCALLNIPFYARTVEVAALARQEKKSLEEAGRDSRYRFFYELRAELDADSIATAHHHDDVAETVLMHLLRGSGLKGLRGIMPKQGNIIRPLLAVSKADIKAYLEAINIEYATDQSNYELTCLRNRIRHLLIPELQQEYNPQIVENLNRLALIARDDNDALEIETRQHWNRLLIKMSPDYIIINKKQLLELHPAYQSRIIREALFKLRGEAGWDSQDVQSIKNLAAKSGSSKKIRLKNAVTANAVYEELHFFLSAPAAVSFNYEIRIPDRINIPEIGVSYIFEIGDVKEFDINSAIPGDIRLKAEERVWKNSAGGYSLHLTPNASRKEIYLDFDKLQEPLFIRSRQAGDRFYPLGIKGSKKIKDYFIDIKLPHSERNKVPILAGNDKIYALLGFKIARLATVSADTRRILRISKLEE